MGKASLTEQFSQLLVVQRLKIILQFIRFVWLRFGRDQGTSSAASLTFTTLLSLVPLMTVVLAIFAAFPMSGQVNEKLQAFVFSNFVPTSGEVLQSYLQDFSGKASQLSGAGFAFLVITALMMMLDIDKAFNKIWRVTSKRSPINVFLEYWAVLSVGPILMAASVGATSYLVSIPLLNEAASVSGIDTVNRFLKLAPLLASSVAFTLLYLVVPNRSVPIRYAFAGGLLAAILFELAKRGFAFYLTNFPSYEAIYGALAILPIFLVWIYLSWIVTLLGAEFTYCLSIFKSGKCQGDGSSNDLLLAYQVLQALWIVQKKGGSGTMADLSESMDNLAQDKLESLLRVLQRAQFVLQTQNQSWALARDLSDIRLYDLYRINDFVLPSSIQFQQLNLNAGKLASIVDDVEKILEDRLSMPLDQLFEAYREPQEKK